MVEQTLAKLRDQSLDEVADGVVLPEKEKPLEPEDNDQTEADQEILFEFGFSSVDDAVDDVFGVIDRGGGEDVETDHADQAEKDQALVGQDQGDQPDEGGSFLFGRFTHLLNLLPVGSFTGILELDSCLGETVPDHVRALEILFFTELIP